MDEYDIHQVARYILVRKFQGNSDICIEDLSEFWRRDQAERVLASLKAMSPEDAAKDARFRSWLYNAPAMSVVSDDGSVSLTGHNGREIFALSPGDAIKNIGGELALVPSA